MGAMASKSRPTLDEHTELGSVLAGLRDELQRCATQLRNAYPQSGPEAQPARKLTDAFKAVDEARSLLENALYREYPQEATTHIYYPQPEDRAAVIIPVPSGGADCPAVGRTTIGEMPARLICNQRPCDGDQHHDVVHGAWRSGPKE